MSLILQKIRYWNQSSILNKCTVDDGVAPNQESLHKLSSVTFEGPLVSRHIAVSLFDKLAKKSSSLSTKIIPVVCYLLRQGSNYFKMEVQYKRTLIVKLMESSLACQGTVVHELYKELVELIEYEYKKSLLGDEYSSELAVPKCISLNDIPVRTKGDITREVQIEAIVSPEKRIVDQITTASCIEPLPPMTEIWKFAAQYKQLNQHAINMELQRVLQGKEPMCQLRALSVVDYLSQHYHNSCQATFLHVVKEIAVCDNMDLKKKAQRILSRLSEDNEITPCPSPPRSPYIGGQTHSNSQNNLVSSHMKRSYDKILPSTVGYQTMTNSDHVDETLLDLGSPCSSNSYNASPESSPSRHRFLSFFSPPPSRQPGSLSRRGSADSSDNLLGAHLESATPV
ncbi:uncharacterized protein LOC134816762 [Bolinopsis microptera]|uniref:uncharacterized protein LOC134816762 n=1 Tax=Bolinopsis microptera TaxID=2820187 RepID=UPI003079E0FC